MNRAELDTLLRSVAAGETQPGDALERLAESPFADLGFARLDLHRELRSGLPEAVFGQGKEPDDLVAICRRLLAAHQRVLATRLEPRGAEALRAALPEATWHPRARVLTCGTPHAAKKCKVAVLVAGTSDLPVAEEAAVCAEWFGLGAERHIDVGVAGVHRVLERLPELRQCDVAIAVAGMDGALPTLIAGLLSVPVIAVPTSVGYGASFHGLAALLTMLNACAPGVAVMNIDNGYGAAVLAQRIASTGDRRALDT
ncbi:MAG: nickel pincer cofactor biosynthesis protein LarB [Acidobacteriota bacterium]